MPSNSTLVGLLENMLLTPTSDFYLSTLLHDPNGQSADPLTASSIDLGTQSVFDVNVGIVLTNVIANGLSDVQVNFVNGVPDVQVNDDTVTFTGKMPNTQDGYTRPPDVPDHLIMSGGLDCTIAGQAMPPGTVSVSVKTASLAGSFQVAGDDNDLANTAQVTFTSVKLSADRTTDNIQIDIQLDTAFKDAIQDALNTPDNFQQLIDQANSLLAGSSTLSDLSDYATQAARRALAAIS